MERESMGLRSERVECLARAGSWPLQDNGAKVKATAKENLVQPPLPPLWLEQLEGQPHHQGHPCRLVHHRLLRQAARVPF